MVGQPVRPRNFLYAAIFFVIVGVLILYGGSEFKYSLIGFIPGAVFLAVFAWTMKTEKRF